MLSHIIAGSVSDLEKLKTSSNWIISPYIFFASGITEYSQLNCSVCNSISSDKVALVLHWNIFLLYSLDCIGLTDLLMANENCNKRLCSTSMDLKYSSWTMIHLFYSKFTV